MGPATSSCSSRASARSATPRRRSLASTCRAPSSSRCTRASPRPSSTACSRRTGVGEWSWPPTWRRPRSRSPGSSASSTPAPRASLATTGARRCSACRSRPSRRHRPPSGPAGAGASRPARASVCTPRMTSTVGRPSPSRRSCARTWRRSSCRWPPSVWARSPPSPSWSRPTPARSRTGSCSWRSWAPSIGVAIATTCASPRSVGGSLGSPPIRAWRAWCSRPTGTAWSPRCSCSPRRCPSRTRGSGPPGASRRRRSTTSGSRTRSRTSSATSTCGATCASSRRHAAPASSARCARPSTSTTSASASGRTCTASSARWRVASASRCVRWPTSPTAMASTGRCWPGCCPTSGCSTPTATSTAAPAEARFVLAPGTALGKRRPKWVMAAELVETNRLRARTVAQITPDRIEQAAGHLVARSYDEPWWDEARGAAMTNERVSLYGLPLVSGRRRAARPGRSAPPPAMLFLRHALVDGDWDGAARLRAGEQGAGRGRGGARGAGASRSARVRRRPRGVLRRARAGRRHHRPPVRPVVEGRRPDATRPAHLCAGRSRRARCRVHRPGRVPGSVAVGRRPPGPHVRARPDVGPRRGGGGRAPHAVGRRRRRSARLAGAGAPARPRHGAPADPAEGSPAPSHAGRGRGRGAVGVRRARRRPASWTCSRRP